MRHPLLTPSPSRGLMVYLWLTGPTNRGATQAPSCANQITDLGEINGMPITPRCLRSARLCPRQGGGAPILLLRNFCRRLFKNLQNANRRAQGEQRAEPPSMEHFRWHKRSKKAKGKNSRHGRRVAERTRKRRGPPPGFSTPKCVLLFAMMA